MTNPAPDPKQVAAALKAAFPDSDVSPDLVAAVHEAVRDGNVISSAQAAEMPPALNFAGTDEAIRYYSGRAVHARTESVNGAPLSSIFEGILPQARVRLPATGGSEPIETGMGLVLMTDRKILSASQVKSLVGRSAERVELITAPRSPDSKGGRFGAIAIYLCYTHETDSAPSFYILEAGTATGQPKVLFYGEQMGGWIKNQHTAYQPTPFSGPTNYYNGLLTMREDDPNEPAMLVVQGRTKIDGGGYIQVTVQYTSMVEPPLYKPLDLILEAAARVGTVGDAMGVSMDMSIKIATSLYGGDSLEWIAKPGE